METDGSNCPEDNNSTDCLLRTLLQLISEQRSVDDAKIDWDPVTFAFTLVIGVFAALIALVPIVQTLLAAGKGNRRTRFRAIGAWSKTRDRQWNKSEWTYEFVVSTPMLRIDTLLDSLRELNIQDAKSGKAFVRTATHSTSRDPFAATWLRFMDTSGLERAGLLPANMSVVVSDYLPDDLIAAPAHAQIGVIVSAAAIAGVKNMTLDEQTGHPIIMTEDFQFELRQHSILGIIGAFSWYDDKKDSPTRPPQSTWASRQEQLEMAMCHARGVIRIQKKAQPSKEAKHGLEVKLFGHGIPSIAFSLDSAFQKHFKQSSFFLPDYNILDEYQGTIASLFFASTPKTAPAIFPSSKLNLKHTLTPLLLNGEYWANAPLEKFGHARIGVWPSRQASPTWSRFIWYDLRRDALRQERNDVDKFDKTYNMSELWIPLAPETAAGKPSALKQNRVQGHRAVLHMCLKMAYHPSGMKAWLDGDSRNERRYLRWLALEQLREVDKWLRDPRHDREVVSTRTILLCNTSMLLSRAERATRGRIFDNLVKGRDWYRPHTACSRHVDMLQALRTLLNDFNLDDKTFAVTIGVDTRNTKQARYGNESEWRSWQLSLFKAAARKHSRRIELTKALRTELFQRFQGNVNRYHSQLLALIGIGSGSSSEYFNIHRTLDRLGTIVIYHSKLEDGSFKPDYQRSDKEPVESEDQQPESETEDLHNSNQLSGSGSGYPEPEDGKSHQRSQKDSDKRWPLWDRFKEDKYDAKTRELDDVIIYRCLIIALLFHTALDSTELLESGLWNRVVPII